MTNKSSTIYIISAVYNNLEYTKRLLESLYRQSFSHYKIIIVDDGSIDGTSEYIKKNYSNVILIHGNGNLWWTGGINLGIKRVLHEAHHGDYILTINNDCIVGKDYLKHIYGCALEDRESIIGSLILDIEDKKTICDAGVKINWKKYKFESIGPKTINEITDDKTIESDIDTLSTKGTLYPVLMFKTVGIFDNKHFPHYISDYEFACRAKGKGVRLILSYEAKVYNDIAKTGIGMDISRQIDFKTYWSLLFSRLSRINIFDHFWFITLSCPLQYKVINYTNLILKSLFLLSFVSPFVYIRKFVLPNSLRNNKK